MISHARDDVAVGVERDGDVGVSEELLDVLGMDIAEEGHGGAGVTGIVEAGVDGDDCMPVYSERSIRHLYYGPATAKMVRAMKIKSGNGKAT